jgi:mono/diheme cytochrome c family protein
MSTPNGPGDGGLTRRESDATEVVDLHEPIYREMAEPKDGYEPPPTWLLFFCLALMGFGGWYLGTYSAGFDPTVYSESSSARPAATAATPTPVDPMVLGKRVFNNCMACHQADGRGVPGNYPPLDGSGWAQGRPDVLAALVLHGLEGPITVEGQTFNQVMPKWSHLSDEQLAAVLTYVRGSWSNSAPPVTPELVAAMRDRTADRTGSWTVAELTSLRDSTEPPRLQTAAAAAVDAGAASAAPAAPATAPSTRE